MTTAALRRAIGTIALSALTLGLLQPAAAVPHADDPQDKVAPALLAAGESSTTGTVIEFGDTADLTAARRIADWDKRGQAVVDALQETAKRSQAAVVAQLAQQGARFRSFWIDNTVYVENGTARLALSAAADPHVAAVRQARTVPLDNPAPGVEHRVAAAAVEWGVADIKADQVWSELGTRGDGVVVANIDSGVRFDHTALAASYRGNTGSGTYVHDYNWFDPTGLCTRPTVRPCDTAGHGSHVMGTMVGDGGEGNRIGVAPGARWIAAKGCEYDYCTEQSLTAAAQWVLAPTDLAGQNPDPAKRPHIVNNSWGSAGGDDWYRDFVTSWVAAGMFPVFANGNSGPDCGTSGSPGDYPESYSVGNYTSSGVISPRSSRGAAADGGTKPDISAPGTDVRSANQFGGYAVMSGTSMASPHVAGTVALMWSRAPALVGDIDGTRQLLDDTARDTADGQCGGDADDNNVYGEGRLDALAVVGAAPAGDTGTVRGTVTDAASGKPVAGAVVAFTGAATRNATTRADGTYTVSLTAGDYQVAVSRYGYRTAPAGTVSVAAGVTVVRDAALTVAPLVRVSGQVLDGTAHGWPLYAKLVVQGTPVSTYTDPGTGRYALQLPEGAAYTVEVNPVYPGYAAQVDRVEVSRATTRNYALAVDGAACTAPGYRRPAGGLRQSFDQTEAPTGWTVQDHGGNAQVWRFDDPGRHGNLTGGTGGFAVLDSDDYGRDGVQDSSLVSPVTDLTGVASPVLEFRTDFMQSWIDRAAVELSVDGGGTWSTVWQQQADVRGPVKIRVPLPAAANQNAVQVRFHYSRGDYAWWWQVDDVYVGSGDCGPAPGGLLYGRTTSTVTGKALPGVRVEGAPADRTVSSATPDDPGQSDGFYWLFAPATHGQARYTATLDGYASSTEKVRVLTDAATRRDFGLGSGRLSAPHTVAATVEQGREATVEVAIANTGDEPATYRLSERDGVTPDPVAMTGTGAPLRQLRAEASPLQSGGSGGGSGSAETFGYAPAGPWTDVAPYPVSVKDTAAGVYGGRLYSVGGVSGFGPPMSAGYSFDPGTDSWSPIAPMPVARQKPAGAFVGGRFVVTGGWGEAPGFAPVADTSIYDPATDTWSTGAPNPRPWAASGSAVLDGQLYVVGGCEQDCGRTDVLRYDPVADTWTRLADYPQPIGWSSCGGIDGKVYCAGGIGPDTDSFATYSYDPATNRWTRVADMPRDMWASAYSVVGDELVVTGGSAEHSSIITNESIAYDPDLDRWRTLPNAAYPRYRTTGACGFFKVGGSDGERLQTDPAVEQLGGLNDCAPAADQPWLSVSRTSGTLKPGKRDVLRVTLDAARVPRPGTYTATLRIADHTPYPTTPITVRLVVKPRH